MLCVLSGTFTFLPCFLFWHHAQTLRPPWGLGLQKLLNVATLNVSAACCKCYLFIISFLLTAWLRQTRKKKIFTDVDTVGKKNSLNIWKAFILQSFDLYLSELACSIAMATKVCSQLGWGLKHQKMIKNESRRRGDIEKANSLLGKSRAGWC